MVSNEPNVFINSKFNRFSMKGITTHIDRYTILVETAKKQAALEQMSPTERRSLAIASDQIEPVERLEGLLREVRQEKAESESQERDLETKLKGIG